MQTISRFGGVDGAVVAAGPIGPDAGAGVASHGAFDFGGAAEDGGRHDVFAEVVPLDCGVVGEEGNVGFVIDCALEDAPDVGGVEGAEGGEVFFFEEGGEDGGGGGFCGGGERGEGNVRGGEGVPAVVCVEFFAYVGEEDRGGGAVTSGDVGVELPCFEDVA